MSTKLNRQGVGRTVSPESMTAKSGNRAKTSVTKTEPKFREPTEGERLAIEASKASLAKRPRRVEISQKPGAAGALTIGQPHNDGRGWSAHVTDTFGTSSQPFAEQSLVRVANAVRTQKSAIPTEEQTNSALAMMGAIAPRDELEAAIGEQIIAAHIASLDFLNRARANAGEYVTTAVTYANAATKLTRTMGFLVETLAKLRGGGRQRIEVVYVNGPAVIGDNAQTVITAGRPGGGGEPQTHTPAPAAHLAAAACPPMPRRGVGASVLPVANRERP